MIQLRPFQKSALKALESPCHLLCIAPTGAGKSLVYERAAQAPGRRTLLVTPLVALARQQHSRLAKLLPTTLGAGNASQGPPDARIESAVWVTSPERLQAPRAMQELRDWRPNFLVVDECHCLWEWGDGFRPAFNGVPGLLREFSIERSLWMTATLPTPGRQHLRQALAPAALVELGAFDLPPRLELSAIRVPWTARAEALLGWVLAQQEPGIVFAPTREASHRISRLLLAAGREALPYHAGLGSEERHAIELRLTQGSTAVIVATSAFGMGMDYPRLQWVALWQAPQSLLALAQSIGRAGRDPSRAARAVVLWEEDDFRLIEWTIQGSSRRAQQLEQVRSYLAGRDCRRQGLRDYFEGARTGTGAEAGTRCGTCDRCVACGIARGAGRAGVRD